MNTSDNFDFDMDDVHEAGDETHAITPAPVADIETQPIWARRAILKAAALGTATAVLVGKARPMLAHTDDKSSCKAGDIEVTGGAIVNEPCSCSANGTFEAIAAFEVTNKNNATRKCIALHLGDGAAPLSGKDFYLFTNPDGKTGSQSISGNGTKQTMYALLGTLPCNFGQECFPGSVVAFQTANNQSDTACPGTPETKYPGGQCRRQKICIIGFSAGLECANSDCSDTGNAKCTVGCGGNLFLKATATGFSNTDCEGQNYTFIVTDPDGKELANKTGSSPQCLTVAPTKSGKYTLTVKDCKGCSRTASQEITVSDIKVTLAADDSTACDGKVTFKATSDGSNCKFAFSVDGTEVQASSTTDTYEYDPSKVTNGLDNKAHKVSVDVDCGGCTASAEKSVQTCFKTTVSAALANRTTRTATESNRKRKRRD